MSFGQAAYGTRLAATSLADLGEDGNGLPVLALHIYLVQLQMVAIGKCPGARLRGIGIAMTAVYAQSDVQPIGLIAQSHQADPTTKGNPFRQKRPPGYDGRGRTYRICG